MENIGKIYYINLDKRIDRKDEFLKEMETHIDPLDITNKVERFPAVLNNDGLLGCTISHLEVVKKARESGHKYFIVFEDDFQFIVSKEEFHNTLTTFFEQVNNGLDFKVAMLAYNALTKEPYNDLLELSKNVQTASAYLVNSKYLDELINCWTEGTNLYKSTGHGWHYCNDQYWKRIQNEKWYIFKTRLGSQRAGFSDCRNSFADYRI